MGEWPEFSLIEDFPLKEAVLAAKLGIKPEDLQGVKTEEIDVFETLTEGLHQIALEQRAWKVTCVDRENKEKVLWVAQGFNSSDLVTWGLQVSQLGAVANLAEEPVGHTAFSQEGIATFS